MSEPKDIELPANMTISTAEALYEHFESLLQDDCSINLDGKAVERADTAGLQLLLIFKETLSKRNLSLKWKETSEALVDAATLIGLKEKLGIA